MNLIPVTDHKTISNAFAALRKRMTRDCERFQRALGWQGGYQEQTVYWNQREEIWSVFDPQMAMNRCWCAFGTDDPSKHKSLNIIMECNPPHEGVDRRCGGAFLTQNRHVFLARSGKIGGGRKGIGKSAFVSA